MLVKGATGVYEVTLMVVSTMNYCVTGTNIKGILRVLVIREIRNHVEI